MKVSRQCSKTTCTRPAVATLTYVYADQTAVLGPLATHAEPHTYDLCADHAARLTAPRGWEVVRLSGDYRPAAPVDDLGALVDAVREPRAARTAPPPAAQPSPRDQQPAPQGGRAASSTDPASLPGWPESDRRGHLRVVRDAPED